MRSGRDSAARSRASPATRYRAVTGALAAGSLAYYCWWATGTRSFSDTAYVAVGVPMVLLLGALLATERPGELHRRVEWPWAVLAGVGAALEAVSLALGGSDPSFPSLSTIFDQLLAWHLLRTALFALWLVLGLALWRPLRELGGKRWPG